ncbi:Myocyte-specific enhancer factor 2D [Labeo rohita]|uniref:Myocyte-specific enhancer factor 2D n=1 Tax=Labeo rohita TaxID=84645 RepID=A0ABQ8L4I0_LABRO|nr:Myocyte-specific enhancer factor 2D [Labeo rohita]
MIADVLPPWHCVNTHLKAPDQQTAKAHAFIEALRLADDQLIKADPRRITITPSSSARNLGVIFDDQLTFKDHIAKTAQSCRFALHNIRKIRPFLTEQATQLLVQALNAAARLVFSEPKRAHVTPLFTTLHWLPIAARIKFKTLMLAYRTTTGLAPAYLHSLPPIYTPSRTLRSASERRLIVPSQRGTKSLSRTFSYTVPGWWNDLPTAIRNANSLTTFKRLL